MIIIFILKLLSVKDKGSLTFSKGEKCSDGAMIYILREIWIQSGPTNGRETSVYFLIFIKILKSGKEEEAVSFLLVYDRKLFIESLTS